MANQLDLFFAALSDPTRRAVIAQLAEGPAPVGALHAGHDMALPTFLRHLKVLETSGLVHSEKKGRVRMVAANPDGLRAGSDWLARHRGMWEARMDRLAALAEDLERTRS